FKKTNGGRWSASMKLIEPDYDPWGDKPKIKANQIYSPYINTSTAVYIDAKGTIHCAFRMYRYLPKGTKNAFSDGRNGVSYMVGYIYSKDGGETWYANNRKLDLPVSPVQTERVIGSDRAEDACGLFE